MLDWWIRRAEKRENSYNKKDAITIAIYGQILSNAKEFINSLTDSTSVGYEFEIGRGSLRIRFIIYNWTYN